MAGAREPDQDQDQTADQDQTEGSEDDAVDRSEDTGSEDTGSEDEEPFTRDPTRVDLGSSGDYGLDAPDAVRNLAYAACGAFFAMFVGALFSSAVVMLVALAMGIALSIVALAMVSSSRVGKIQERVRIVDAAGLSADDYVLDLGCGRGLLLVEAARRVPDGLAVGADVFSAVDQSRNIPSAPLDNAVIERVEDRVAVVAGDGRSLPYVDGAFDAVVSSMVVHNISEREGRARVIREASRVVRPGGRLVVVDMRRTAEYVAILRAQHWADVRRSRARWRMFPPVRYV
ncbi:MAG: class I SAM-dependent methyltransferase, partial [Acidimicrobiia bacterium]|nr:class I SAM-dependent methyltransferase [Acidimicrobiia bacterium]